MSTTDERVVRHEAGGRGDQHAAVRPGRQLLPVPAVADDPFGSLLRGSRVPSDKVEQLRTDFGLDEPTWKQFFLHLRQTAQLDFGLSFQTRQPVWDDIQARSGRPSCSSASRRSCR
ncbi:MAG: hypothetical protein R2697_03590 [Ilumatobacteraceae bacterium]